eukprot:TRINITY_DN22584_c0_g1_i1.p1 TRINITY_DN22584_c0_g1~~TRINITY_DN22584_c0_g1_i1.p1  ORF type:complete len:462 (+),score=78.74 TRINITY_DN22584_c0_g1_i1:90-1475(+)
MALKAPAAETSKMACKAEASSGGRWVDEHACAALCLLILADSRQGSFHPAGLRGAAELRASLPPFIYAQHIAPFLRFEGLLPNMLFVFGGRCAPRGPTNTVEMLDSWSGEWLPCQPMRHRRAGGAAAPLPDGRILVVGGYNERGIFEGMMGSCEIYDPYTEQWQQDGAASLKRPRWGHSCVLFQGQVWTVGGCSWRQGLQTHQPWQDNMTTLGSCEVYDPSANEWTEAAPLQVARSGCRVVALSCGKRLVAVGGLESVFSHPDCQATIEIYDVDTACWAKSDAKLRLPTTNAGVAALQDSRIFVAGGFHSRVAQVYHVDKKPSDSSLLTLGGQDETGREAEESDFIPREDVPLMPSGRMGCQAVLMKMPSRDTSFPVCTRSCVVLVGGEKFDSPPSSPRQSVHAGEPVRVPRQLRCMTAFDLESGEWREAASLPSMATARATAAICLGVGRTHARIRGSTV